jgi:four helix bundle protein
VLVSQIRRAVISVCSNIAEGASRISKTEKKRFYEISRSSLVEIDTQFEIAIILEYYKKGQMQELEQYLESTFRMLSKMIGNLSSNPTRH